MPISGLCTHAYSVLHICTQACMHLCSHTYQEHEKILTGKFVFSWFEKVYVSVFMGFNIFVTILYLFILDS